MYQVSGMSCSVSHRSLNISTTQEQVQTRNAVEAARAALAAGVPSQQLELAFFRGSFLKLRVQSWGRPHRNKLSCSPPTQQHLCCYGSFFFILTLDRQTPSVDPGSPGIWLWICSWDSMTTMTMLPLSWLRILPNAPNWCLGGRSKRRCSRPPMES